MERIARWCRGPLERLLMLIGLAAVLGCQSGPIEFSDTEERAFVAECSDRGCTYRRKTVSPARTDVLAVPVG